MLMPNPVPEVTTGPQWSQDLSDSLDLVDSHDHTSNKGVRVPALGLNINADLDFQSNAASGLRAILLEDQVANPSESGAVYIKNGDFFLKNTAGQVIQLTSGSSINVGAGSIGGLVSPASATFSSITNTFTWLYDTSLPARQVMSDISLYEYGNNTAQPVTLASPSGVTAHTMLLPPLAPVRGSLLSIATSGQISNFSSSSGFEIPRMNAGGTDVEFSTVDTNSISNLAVTTGKIADGAVLIQKLYSRTISASPASEGNVGFIGISQNVTATSPVLLGSTLTLSTQGRPVMLVLQPKNSASSPGSINLQVSTGNALIEVRIDGTIVRIFTLGISTGGTDEISPSSISCIVQPSGGGSHSIELYGYVSSGGLSFAVNDCELFAYEL